MHSLPFLRSLTKEASRCVYPAAGRQRQVLAECLEWNNRAVAAPKATVSSSSKESRKNSGRVQ